MENSKIDISIAFDAMVIFLEKYWILQGKPENIGIILSSMDRDINKENMPFDMAT